MSWLMYMYTELIHYDLGSESSDTDTRACYLNQQKMLYIYYIWTYSTQQRLRDAMNETDTRWQQFYPW